MGSSGPIFWYDYKCAQFIQLHCQTAFEITEWTTSMGTGDCGQVNAMDRQNVNILCFI